MRYDDPHPQTAREGATCGRRRGATSCAALAFLALLALMGIVRPGLAVAQEAAVPGDGAEIRVVERFDPADSRRSYRLVHPLTPGERQSVEGALRRAGMHLPRTDGVFDEATRRALGRFQRREGLEPCRCVDYETVTALGLGTRVVLTELASAGRPAGSAAADGVEVVYPRTPSPVRGRGKSAPAGASSPDRRTESGPADVGSDGRAGEGGEAPDRSVHDRSVHDRDIHRHGFHGHGFHAHHPFFFPAVGREVLRGAPGEGASGSRADRGRSGVGAAGRFRVSPGPLFRRPVPPGRVPFPGSRARPR